VRLRLRVLSKDEAECVLDADETLEAMVRLEIRDALTVRRLVGDEGLELVDVTTHPPKRLTAWGSTLQSCGLWPSARLVVRPLKMEVVVRTVASDEARVRLRPDETVAELGRRGFLALPAAALPGVDAAAPMRVVFNGRQLDPAELCGAVLPKEGAVVFLAPPPPPPPPGISAPQSSSSAPAPRWERRACRICMEEELVDITAPTTTTTTTTTSRRRRRRRERPTVPDDDDGTRFARLAAALGRAATAATERGRSQALAEARRVFRGLLSLDGDDDDDDVDGSSSQNRRLISPCLCSGTMKYVHLECLNQWRAAAPNARSLFRCDQCGYEYRVRRVRFASFLLSDWGAPSIAAAALACAVVAAGELLTRRLAYARQRQLYAWLRLAPPASRLGQVGVLGCAAVGLAAFVVYALGQLATTALYIRLGVQWRRASEPALLLGLWVAAEAVDLKRARALAVVGFAVAGRLVLAIALKLARRCATNFADRILDVN